MDQVEEIKSKVDITEIISGYIPMKKAGRNWKANCPFHDEKTPSFMVNPELKIFKCFGCGLGGDVYTFLQNIEGMTFGEALKNLADRVGIKLTSYKPSQQEEDKEKLIRINTLATEAYQFLLTKHKIGKPALDYLLSRGVTSESIKKFALGYAPNEWNFLNDFLVKKKNFYLADLVKAGLVVEGKNYDRFRDRIMFPLNNSRGEVMGFAGRVLPSFAKATEGQAAKYINSSETEIYHKSELLYGFDITRSEIKSAGFAVVVEGELDAICTYQTGIKNVVAIKGSALTEKQVETLRRVTDVIVLALDADMAGNMAARRGIEIAQKKGLFIYTVDWNLTGGEVKDAADLAISNPELLKELIKKRISIYSFYIDSAIKKFGISPEAKSRIIDDVLSLLKFNTHEGEVYEYLKELGKKIDIPVDVINKEMNKLHSPLPKSLEQVVLRTEDAGEMMEKYLVGLAIRHNKIDLLIGVIDLYKSEFWLKVAKALIKSKNVNSLPAELKEKTQDLIFEEEEKNYDAEKDWENSVDRLKKLRLGRKNAYIDR